MSYDVFGDLQEWGQVLGRVEKMRQDGTLEHHQQGLARLARYPFNWQLRHASLRAIAELIRPGDEVLRIAVQIMVDDRNDIETRLLAGRAVNGVLRNGDGTITNSARSEAAVNIEDFLAKPQPPVLRELALKMPAVSASRGNAITTTK